MAKISRGGSKSSVIVTRLSNANANEAINQDDVVTQTQNNQTVYDTTGKYTDMTSNEQDLIYKQYQKLYNGNTKTAIKMYIADDTKNTSKARAMSQRLNYALDNGHTLDANLKYIDTYLQKAMHPITKNTNLVKYGHSDIVDGVLKQIGMKSDYQQYTDSQLKKALVGVTFQQKSFSSYAYNESMSPFAPSQPLGGGREVIFKLKANANTNIAFGNRKQAEVILNKNQNFKINNVYYDGTTATPKNQSPKKRIVVELESI